MAVAGGNEGSTGDDRIIVLSLLNADTAEAVQTQALPDKRSGVHVTTGVENGKNIIIKVMDEGKGMDETTLARLTEPFFTTRTDEGGTGLGLYISESILKEHEGTLEFQSEPGMGTTAICRLPLAEKQETHS